MVCNAPSSGPTFGLTSDPTSGPASPVAVGLDVGSTGAKATVLDTQSRRILATAEVPTGWEPVRAAALVLEDAMTRCGVQRSQLQGVLATGYGREAVEANWRVTEITCHARGALQLVPGARTVLDIGGQDSKIIALHEDGSVRDFLMNDKCAAGTGRFVANMAMAMGIALEDFGRLAASGTPVQLSSMCAVFAESEVIGLTARGTPREDLAAGIVASIARRLRALAGRIPFVLPVAFTGGLARNPQLVACLQEGLGVELTAPALAPFAGAVGAAHICCDRLSS